jgi:hypothetical protein
MSMKRVICAAILLGFVFSAFVAKSCVVVFNPQNPAASGYVLVFDSEFNDFNDFDQSCNASAPSDASCTSPQGKNWYLSTWSFPNHASNTTTDMDIEPAPFPSHKANVLHMHPSQGTGGWAISTMATAGAGGASHGPAAWQQGWNGRVFTGGWYVEARASTEYTSPACCGFVGGHFTVWSYAIDRKITTASQWAEDDFLDGLSSNHEYLTGILDWQAPPLGTGNVDVTSSDGCIEGASHLININCGGFPNNFPDRTGAHIFSQLWVPATATTQGFVQEFFDGVSMGFYRYNQCGGIPCARDGSVLDLSHMQVNLGNDQGSGTTSWWDWVHIWQLPAAAAASGNAQVTPQPGFTGSTYP